MFEVYVGNIGRVAFTAFKTEAEDTFEFYKTASQLGKGRGAGQNVVLNENGYKTKMYNAETGEEE